MNPFIVAMLVMQANWIPAGSGEMPGFAAQGAMAYDASSISRSGGNVRLQLRLVLSAPEDGIKSLIMSVEFGCAGRTITMHHVTAYSETGSMIESRDMQAAELVALPITANMLEYSIIQRVCA